jgi:hypothetical protein
MMSRKLARDYMHRLIHLHMNEVGEWSDDVLDISCLHEVLNLSRCMYPSTRRDHSRFVTDVAAKICREDAVHEPGILRTVMGEVCRRDGISGKASRWWERTPRQESTAALVAVRAYRGVEEMKSLLNRFDEQREAFMDRELTDDDLAEFRRTGAKIKELLTAAGVEGP